MSAGSRHRRKQAIPSHGRSPLPFDSLHQLSSLFGIGDSICPIFLLYGYPGHDAVGKDRFRQFVYEFLRRQSVPSVRADVSHRHGRDELVPLFLVNILHQSPISLGQSSRLSSLPSVQSRFALLPTPLLRLSSLLRGFLRCDFFVLLVWIGQGKFKPSTIVIDKVGQWRCGECSSEFVQ